MNENINYPFLCKSCNSNHIPDKNGLVHCCDQCKPYLNTISRDSLKEESKDALRFNEGKTPYGELPLDLLDRAAVVMSAGGEKYGKGNYRKGYDNLSSPLSSLIRHIVSVQQAIDNEDVDGSKGFLLDSESKEAHIHHVITSALLLVQAFRMKKWRV